MSPGEGERAARRIWGLTRRLRGAFGLTPPTRSSLRAVGLAGRVLLSPPNPAAPLSPAAQDTYWAGTAPICLGGCKGKHKELKRSQCGAGSCCWLGYKSFCRVNCGRPEADFNSLVHGNDWWVGSVVRYSCRPGYLLLGDPASACQPDGRWTPKPTCLRICLRGRIELSEREVSGGCSSSCGTLSHLGSPSPARGCIKISACVPKRPGWARWFLRCDRCECDCYVPCGGSQ
ncbi:C4b-binding protein-like [Anas platyrhynchos]|uniref:C4b-binding protein-like n=1 Tax=Anas platyrhynchos TaxID=8839 RepID=UPI003AF29560